MFQPATAATSQDQPDEQFTPVSFSVVRIFSQPDIASELLYAELVQKAEGDVSMADVVDLNLAFSKLHGKPSIMPLQMAPKTNTLVLRFPDGWWSMNMVRADGEGKFACRVLVNMDQEKPDPKIFEKYVFWCQATLTLSTLDPEILVNKVPQSLTVAPN